MFSKEAAMTKLLWTTVILGVCLSCVDRADVPLEEEMAEQIMAGSVAPPGRFAMVPAKAPGEQTMARTPQAPATPAVPAVEVRKIIRNGYLNLEVSSVEEALADIKALVDSANGYVTNESVSQDQYATKSGTITCRVPSEQLDGTLEELKKLGKVEHVSITANDITDQYFDLEVRMRNQKALEERLVSLLKRPTNKLADLLAAERELARVRTDIDAMEGRKRLWDNQIAYSTVTINVREPGPVVQGGGVFRMLWRSFGRSGENFVLTVAELISLTGTLVPLALAGLFAFWGGRKLWRRRRKSSES
jgi:hypothetical protein